jgi:hypothetical protein
MDTNVTGTLEVGEEVGASVPDTLPTEEKSDWGVSDLFNVYNPWFGTGFNTGLNIPNPTTRVEGWNPDTAEWAKDLSVEDKIAISNSNSEEHAQQVIAKRRMYEDSKKALAEDPITTTILGIGTSFIDPTLAIPIGVTGTATKAAYTLSAKATKLAALSTESALVSMTSATIYNAAERGQGLEGQEYGTLNMYAALIGGGLPVLGSMLSTGYGSVKIAKSLTTTPKNTLIAAGEIALEQTGGTQLRTPFTSMLNKVGLSSDVTYTASSNNEFVTMVSNRMDSPPVAVIDKGTGKPVAIGTTGQDYGLKFNGRQTMTLSDTRALQKESTYDNLDDFNLQVGTTIRNRAVEQEQLVYKELEDAIKFTTDEIKKEYRAERESFLKGVWEVKDPTTGEWKPATQELLDSGIPSRVKKPTKKQIKEYDNKILSEREEEISKAIDAKREELYQKYQLEFKHSDPKVVEAATKIDEYYKGVLEEAHRLKVHEFKHITPNRHYMTRIFDFQKVREMDMDTLVARLKAGLKGHVANRSMSEETLNTSARNIAAKLKDLDYTRDYADYTFFVPKEIGSTAFFREKQFKLDDRAIQDILVTDIEDVVGQYSYSQKGHLSALHAFPELQGIPREEQVNKFNDLVLKPLRESGAKAKEVDALENMFDDMLGTFRIAKDSNSAVWKSTRIANSINSLTYGGGFALNTAAEIGGLLLDGQVANVMKSRLGTLSEIGTMFTKSRVDDPLARDFILMGQFENLMETNHMMKMSDTDTVFNAGKVEHNLNKANNEFFKYTGLRGATVALEAIVGPKVIHDILNIGTKKTLSNAEAKYMARIGLNPEDAVTIANKLKEVGEFKGNRIYDMHLDKWDDVALDKLTTAVERGMRHTVIRGDTTYLPSFMIKPNAFNRLIFQFLRYPMAATETLMARGLDESPARWLAATMTSTFMMASVMYTREQAAIATGMIDEKDAKYADFLTDEEQATKLFAAAFGKAGTLGGSSIILNRLQAVTGYNVQPGQEYVSPDVLGAFAGPTFGRLTQARDLLEPVFTEGRVDTKDQWNALQSVVPGLSLPLISEGLRAYTKNEGL